MQLFSKTVRRAAMLFAWLASATLVAIMAMTFVDVIGRTFFGRSLIGTVESVELMMGVLVFSGLALTEVQRKHIIVETFQGMFPRNFKRVSVILNSLLAFTVVAVLSRQLILKTIEIWHEGEFTMIMKLPYWPSAVIMSAGMVLFLIVLFLRLIQDIFRLEDA